MGTELNTNFKYGMVIDLDSCTGCGACAVACGSENNVYTRQDESDKVRSINWIRIHQLDNGKPFPENRTIHMPMPCMHCDKNTPCVEVCPVSATTIDEAGGIVSQIPSRCIGCRYCIAACPYHSRSFNWWDPWPTNDKDARQLAMGLNPEVSPRTRGVVEKCTFCHHRLMAARANAYAEGRRELAEIEYQPACVEACPTNAMTFGQITDPSHAVYNMLKHENSFRLLESIGIEPKVFYISKDPWVRRMAEKHIKSLKAKADRSMHLG